MIKAWLRASRRVLTYRQRRGQFRAMIDAGFPHVLIRPMEFLLSRKVSPETRAVIHKIEGIRRRIAAKGDREVTILYSPKPGSSGADASASARPHHGEVLTFTMEQVARTGKNRYWGTFLHLLAVASRANTIIELGSCAGISACYLASSSYCKSLITVEGSPGLASLARSSLQQVSSSALVYNKLFDDAMDEFLPTLEAGIDLAFVDGHHERVATIHYFERLRPKLNEGAVVVFDDISWSSDMREAWIELSHRRVFTHAVDCGTIGVCMWTGDEAVEGRYWDLQPIIGGVSVGSPHGWT